MSTSLIAKVFPPRSRGSGTHNTSIQVKAGPTARQQLEASGGGHVEVRRLHSQPPLAAPLSPQVCGSSTWSRAAARLPRTPRCPPRPTSLQPRPFPRPPRARATGRSPPSSARRRASPAPLLTAKMAESGEGLGTVPEHERILQEIQSTDTACVGPTLR